VCVCCGARLGVDADGHGVADEEGLGLDERGVGGGERGVGGRRHAAAVAAGGREVVAEAAVADADGGAVGQGAAAASGGGQGDRVHLVQRVEGGRLEFERRRAAGWLVGVGGGGGGRVRVEREAGGGGWRVGGGDRVPGVMSKENTPYNLYVILVLVYVSFPFSFMYVLTEL
jgi:hypothetical protein